MELAVTTSPGLDELSAEELAVRAQGGSEACFAELVARHRPALVAFLARRLSRPADADDVAQETFLRAYRNLDRYDPARRFATWLYAIGKNVAANHARAEVRRGSLERAAAPSAGQAAGAPARGEDAGPDGAAMWARARAALGAEVYRALWLRYARDLSVREIAAELGRSSVSVKVMLFRARRKLLEETP